MKHLLSSVLLAVGVLAFTPNTQAATVVYIADLNGASEVPPNASPGTGTARIAIDTKAHSLGVFFNFKGLTSGTTAAHIHGPTALPGEGTAGVISALPTFPGTPLGVTEGGYKAKFNTSLASTYNSEFVEASGGVAKAEAALASILAAGTAYFNVHTTQFEAGEIRGNLAPIPLPAGLGLLLTGLAGLAALGRVRRDAR